MTGKQRWDAVWQNSKGPKPSQLVEEIDREQRSQRCQRILRFLETQGFNLAGLSVVEVGCGSAIYSCIMARLGADVTALDQSEAALSRAQERAEAIGVALTAIKGDALEFAKSHREKCDLAMSLGTVEQLPSSVAGTNVQSPLGPGEARWHRGDLCSERPVLPHEILKRLLLLRGKWLLG